MMKRVFFNLILLLVFCWQAGDAFCQNSKGKRPKIGVTLSGGGAKGLAHVGILKAIDSAGLKVDYLTGTSMGSIVGALYAIGYSGKQIEEMAGKMDWSSLLTNQSNQDEIIMEEKEEYGKYAVEIPYSNGKFKIKTGILESEELWLKLSNVFYPVFGIKDFNQFSIPFKCIATNAANGEAVVLDKGEIVTAVRASMAIPSVFTAVRLDSMKLVDGGVVRNFPVEDVKRMGADFVIGINVSAGLSPASQLNNPIAILMNAVFFKAAEDAKKEIPLCDIYIPMPVENFSTSSFNRSAAIIDTGVAVGERLYPYFKKLKDSLDAIYGYEAPPGPRLPEIKEVLISEVEIEGLQKTSKSFFLEFMGFELNKEYGPDDIGLMIRRGFGHRYYDRITYELEPLPDGKTKIRFLVSENPLAAAKMSIHFNKFSGLALIVNFTIRNLITNASRSLITANLGERLRARAEHMEFFGKHKNFAAKLSTYYEFLDFTSYQNYSETGIYRQRYFDVDLHAMYSMDYRFTVGLGSRYEYLDYTPSIKAYVDAKGRTRFFNSYLMFKYNTVDRKIYPRRGLRGDASVEWIYAQKGNIVLLQNGQEILNTDTISLHDRNYLRTNLYLEGYVPVGQRGTITALAESGMNYDYNLFFQNDYYIGGLTRMFRNQVIFAGYPEGVNTTSSYASLQLGYRFQLFNNIFLIWRSNAMFYDLLDHKYLEVNSSFLSGHALSVGYLSIIGPIEFSVMYGDQSKQFQTYINIGFSFY